MLLEPTAIDVDALESTYRTRPATEWLEGMSRFSPPESWTLVEARNIAARIIHVLGAPRRARLLHIATYRRAPIHPRALYFYALDVYERHGPLEALRLLEERHPEAAPPAELLPAGEDLTGLWLLRARCLGAYRDFDRALAWHAAAERARPEDPWIFVEKAGLLERLDDYAGALEAAQRAVALEERYRPSVSMLAHVLSLVGREDEAAAVLRRQLQVCPNASHAVQLVQLLQERQALGELLEVLALAERCSPLAEKSWLDWFAARRADALHGLGRDDEAAAAARAVPGKYYERFVQKVTAATDPAPRPARVLLPVGFVRQHHVTCAPATLSAVAAYWGRPVDHLALARVITYDGTPDHEERHWMEAEGWLVREFTVTWETAAALLGRGVPFTLVTTYVQSAHLQAVIGCDPLLGTFIVRDPYHRVHFESLAAEFLEQQAPQGPRGMILLPPAEAGRLEGIDLADCGLYDRWYRLRRALHRHDRALAEAERQALETEAPGHRLTLWARRELAYYDQNPFQIHEAVMALRARFPKEPNLRFEELASLDRLGRRADHEARLREFAFERGADPAFWRTYVDALNRDPAESRRSQRYARRLVRVRPLEWQSLNTLAGQLWDDNDRERATRCYRLAALLGDKVESAWWSYFVASRHGTGTEEVLHLLRARARRLGPGSSQPAQTLFRALEQLDRGGEARAALEEALRLRPDDGDLHLAIAKGAGRAGDHGKAAEYLASAAGRCSAQGWHRTAATLAGWTGQHARCLAGWRAVLEANPLDQEAQREAAEAMALTEGTTAVQRWMQECVQRHPHYLPLRQLRLEWLRRDRSGECLAECEEYLKLFPEDAWGWREKALILLGEARPLEALAAAEQAVRVDPRASASHGILGRARLALDRRAEARAATEEGLRRSIDADWLMSQLLEYSFGFEERRAAVQFLMAELDRQPTFGSGFWRFREVANGVLSPQEIQAAYRRFRETRPGHWEIWSASIQQELALDQAPAAKAIAAEATRMFPLIARLWVDTADVSRRLGEIGEETAALERARELAPAWPAIVTRLVAVHQRALHGERAEQVAAAAVHFDPNDASLRAIHAETLWQVGRRTEAIEAAERAVRLMPGYDYGWNLLNRWAAEEPRAREAGQLIRRIAEERPADPAARLRLARQILNDDDPAGALAEIERAIERSPRHDDAHDLRAVVLAQLGRYGEAMAACHPLEYSGGYPVLLRGRAAWVRWQRGESQAAAADLRGVVQAHPDYAWGWQLLAEWLNALDDNTAAVEAAKQFARLRPDEVQALGWVAALELKGGRKREAIPHLEQALRIDPGYLYAAGRLLELRIEFEEWGEAERLRDLVEQQGGRWEGLKWRVILEAKRKRQEPALQAFAQLALAPAHVTDLLREAAETLFAAGWVKELYPGLLRSAGEAGANPEIGAIWERARQTAAKRRSPAVLDRAAAAEPVRHRAWQQHLEFCGETKRSWRIRWTLWRRGGWLRGSDESWSAAGYALAATGQHARLVRWMRGWEQRPGKRPWVLQNYAQSLLQVGDMVEFERAVAAALKMPADHTRPMFVAWAALLAALRGDVDEARLHLGHYDNTHTMKFAKVAARQAEALVRVLGSPEAGRPAAFKEGKETLRRLKVDFPDILAVDHVKRTDLRVRHAMAKAARSPWRWFYFTVAFPPWVRATGFVVLCLFLLVLGVAAIATGAGVAPLALLGWALASKARK